VIDRKAAEAIRDQYIARINEKMTTDVRPTCALRSLDQGWLFYWNSAAYLDGGDWTTSLVGQGPIIILRDGAVLEGGSADQPIDVLRRYGRMEG
jgi:hypothetical protein